jgi:hypothetical protein
MTQTFRQVDGGCFVPALARPRAPRMRQVTQDPGCQCDRRHSGYASDDRQHRAA